MRVIGKYCWVNLTTTTQFTAVVKVAGKRPAIPDGLFVSFRGGVDDESGVDRAGLPFHGGLGNGCTEGKKAQGLGEKLEMRCAPFYRPPRYRKRRPFVHPWFVNSISVV